jgi:pimeloyl-ACP methyl ester carboxylesterase
VLTDILIVVFAVLSVGASVFLFFCYFLSRASLRLDRQPVPKTPADYGMDFQSVEFTTADAVKIKGWLIPGTSKKQIVMTHVGGLTKYGSTRDFKSFSKLFDEEIEFLKVARYLHGEGYGVLMFDFRNHGESDTSPNGGKTAVGLEEYQDVVAAMDYLQSNENTRDAAVGFVSFCMGANSTIVAMSKQPDAFRNVKCMVAVQPISMEVFVRTYAKRRFTNVGGKLLFPVIRQFVNWQSKYPLPDMSPRDYVKDLKVPTLYVQVKNDPWTELSDITGFYENTPSEKEFFWLEGLTHRFQGYQYFGDHPEKMRAWLKKWM